MQREYKVKELKHELNPLEAMRLREIQFALDNLNKRSIYKTHLKDDLSAKLQEVKKNQDKRAGRASVRMQWINEFSDAGSE